MLILALLFAIGVTRGGGAASPVPGSPLLSTSVSRPSTTVTPAQSFVETWADKSSWQGVTGWGNFNWTNSLNADDGFMGSAYLRNGSTSGFSGFNMGGPIFDERSTVMVNYKMRINTPACAAIVGGHPVTYGALYSGEAWYGGGINITTYGGADCYGTAITGAGAVGCNSAFTVDTTWDASARQLKTRINGGTYAVCAGNGGHVNFPPHYPVTIWAGAFGDSIAIDMANVAVTGSHLWGAADDYGWGSWLTNNAATISSCENDAAGGRIGGLTGVSANSTTHAYDGAACGGVDAGGLTAASGNWSASSTIAGLPATYHYADLRLAVTNFRVNQIELFARYSSDGSSVFRDVHGNDMDLLASMQASRQFVKTVDLSGVTASRTIYLDVRGHTDAAWGSMNAQPRLMGAWISYSQ